MARSSWRFSGRQRAAGVSVAVVLCFGAVEAMVGGESGAYLRTPVGATSCAMGGAGTASPEFLCSWWNPAVLSTYKRARAAFGMGVRSLGRMEGYGSGGFRVPPRVGLGATILYRGDPFLSDLHDENENVYDRAAYTTLTLKTGLSYFITRRWSAGLSIGVYYQSLPTDDSEAPELGNSTTAGIGGFDFAARFEALDNWTVALVLRNVAAAMDWEIRSASLSPTIEDKPLPQIVAGSRVDATFLARPLVWTCDVVGHVVDGDWKKLPRPELRLHNGVEWQRWEKFWIRAGLGELAVNGLITDDPRRYFRSLGPRITAGFAADLSRILEGLRLNYAASTDRAWAGVDQVLDVTYVF